jgi:hypothetical protein
VHTEVVHFAWRWDLANPAGDLGVDGQARIAQPSRTGAAGHNENVGFYLVEDIVGDQGACATFSAHWPLLAPNKLDLRPWQAPKYVERSDSIERRDTVEHQKRDLHLQGSFVFGRGSGAERAQL